MIEKLFKLKENKTNAKTEIAAGITTFMTMAYILAVNPNVLSATGMDRTAVLLATCLASFIGTLCMALMVNLPFALSAGIGLNAYLAYTVVLDLGYTWQTALLAVFTEGIIFIVLSLTNVREAIFNCIPLSLKKAVSVGIGLFICFIGLQNAGLSADSATLVSLVDFTESFSTTGICRRPHRSDISDNRIAVPCVDAVCAYLHCNSIICHCSCAHYRVIPDVQRGNGDKIR